MEIKREKQKAVFQLLIIEYSIGEKNIQKRGYYVRIR
jgi:hypothetical protein